MTQNNDMVACISIKTKNTRPKNNLQYDFFYALMLNFNNNFLPITKSCPMNLSYLHKDRIKTPNSSKNALH